MIKDPIDVVEIIDMLFEEVLNNNVPLAAVRQSITGAGQKILRFRERQLQRESKCDTCVFCRFILPVGYDLREQPPIDLRGFIYVGILHMTPAYVLQHFINERLVRVVIKFSQNTGYRSGG